MIYRWCRWTRPCNKRKSLPDTLKWQTPGRDDTSNDVMESCCYGRHCCEHPARLFMPLPLFVDVDRWPPGRCQEMQEIRRDRFGIHVHSNRHGVASAYHVFEDLGRRISDVCGDSQKGSFIFSSGCRSIVTHRFNAALFRDMFTWHNDSDLYAFHICFLLDFWDLYCTTITNKN